MFKLKSQYFPQSVGNARGQTTWAGLRHDFAFVIFISPWPVQVFHQEAEHNLGQEGVDMEGLDNQGCQYLHRHTRFQRDVPAENGLPNHSHPQEEQQNALVQ